MLKPAEDFISREWVCQSILIKDKYNTVWVEYQGEGWSHYRQVLGLTEQLVRFWIEEVESNTCLFPKHF